MSKSISLICLFLLLGLQMVLGQTKSLNGNLIYKPSHKLKSGMNVYVQHITDAPGIKNQYGLIDLNNSNVTLKSRDNSILVLQNNEISGFWYVNYKTKITTGLKISGGVLFFILTIPYLSSELYVGASVAEILVTYALTLTFAASSAIFFATSENKYSAIRLNLNGDNIKFKKK
jgi:hypothetical protein